MKIKLYLYAKQLYQKLNIIALAIWNPTKLKIFGKQLYFVSYFTHNL